MVQFNIMSNSYINSHDSCLDISDQTNKNLNEVFIKNLNEVFISVAEGE